VRPRLLRRGESWSRRWGERSWNGTSAPCSDLFDTDHDRFQYSYLGPECLPARGSDCNGGPRSTTSEPLGDFAQPGLLEDEEMSAEVAGCEIECPLEMAKVHWAAFHGDRQYRESEFLMDDVLKSSGRIAQLGGWPG
jgi:hypothetical protein